MKINFHFECMTQVRRLIYNALPLRMAPVKDVHLKDYTLFHPATRLAEGLLSLSCSCGEIRNEVLDRIYNRVFWMGITN